MLAIGDIAPAFTLPSTTGGTVSLADLRGRYVVVYFYPKDMTPGCTLEAMSFRDAEQALAKRNAVVLGISRDSLTSHARFAEKCRLGFALLADPDATAIRAYGAWGEKKRFGRVVEGIRRTTVIIDPAGRVGHVFRDVRVAGHAMEVVAKLDELEQLGGGKGARFAAERQP